MTTLYYAPTPNGMKPVLLACEHDLDLTYQRISLAKREQFAPDFLKISPNNKIPALTDGDVSLFESGVIMEYLADQHLGFLDHPRRYQILSWVYWQVGGLGPMGGQHRFFREMADEEQPLATKRFAEECARLYGVLDGYLADNEWIGGADYHIADMTIYPWARYYGAHDLVDGDYPHVNRWYWALSERDSVIKAYEQYG